MYDFSVNCTGFGYSRKLPSYGITCVFEKNKIKEDEALHYHQNYGLLVLKKN